jgi:hypothetical protein
MRWKYYRWGVRGTKAGVLAVAVLAVAWVPGAAVASTATAPLTGTFNLTPGSCAGGAATGSYIRMILPSGNANGPFFSNSDSTCGSTTNDQTYTLMAAGTDGGLVTGSYQPNPTPAFTSSGSARADGITASQSFEGSNFAMSTNPVDPQTGQAVPAPTVSVSGDTLSGNVSSLSVAWNNQNFNQGSPKPGGAYTGATSPLTGTYDASTGAFTLGWISQVVGGPFNDFAGEWHLTGHFVSATKSSPSGAGSTATTTAVTAPSADTPAAGSANPSSAPGPGATGTGSGSASGQATTGAVSTGNGTASSAPGRSAPATKQAATTKQQVASRGASLPAEAAPGSEAGPGLASTTTTTRRGWRSPAWLVATITAIGLLGLVALLLLDQRIRKASVDS